MTDNSITLGRINGRKTGIGWDDYGVTLFSEDSREFDFIGLGPAESAALIRWAIEHEHLRIEWEKTATNMLVREKMKDAVGLWSDLIDEGKNVVGIRAWSYGAPTETVLAVELSDYKALPDGEITNCVGEPLTLDLDKGDYTTGFVKHSENIYLTAVSKWSVTE